MTGLTAHAVIVCRAVRTGKVLAFTAIGRQLAFELDPAGKTTKEAALRFLANLGLAEGARVVPFSRHRDVLEADAPSGVTVGVWIKREQE